MSTRLFVTDIGGISLDRVGEISPDRAERVRRLRFDDDKRRCIASGLFMKNFLGGKTVTTNEFGKPECEGVCFNISHSGEYVIFALSDSEIGCDIEKIKPVNALRLGRVVFCESEMQTLNTAVDRLEKFFSYWTRKEALLKCMGDGFHRGAKTVDVSNGEFRENGVSYFIKQYDFSDYIISLCGIESSFPKYVEFIKL